MSRSRFTAVVVALALLMRASESASYAALAAKSGKPHFTARLSSNKAIRKQQLIVDPDDIVGGSASVLYDPRIVSLFEVLDPGDFTITGGFVSVVGHEGAAPTLEPLSEFLAASADDLRGTSTSIESGYVQIFFSQRRQSGSLTGGGSVISNLPGYATVSQDGVTGINDTDAIVFDYLPTQTDRAAAAYTVFATPPRHGTVADSLVEGDDPDRPIPFDQIAPAFVTGALDPGVSQVIPLPPAAAVGLLTLGFYAMLHRAAKRYRGTR